MRHSHLYWKVAQSAALMWCIQTKEEEGIISRGAFISKSSSIQRSLTIRSYLWVMQGLWHTLESGDDPASRAN